jgi:hypothetical protein
MAFLEAVRVLVEAVRVCTESLRVLICAGIPVLAESLHAALVDAVRILTCTGTLRHVFILRLPPMTPYPPLAHCILANCILGSNDFDIFLEIQYASCVFGLALKS